MQVENALATTNSYKDILTIAEKADAQLSFWGSRYVIVEGYEGALDIDALAEKTIGIIREKNHVLENNERDELRQVTKFINRLYTDSDAQVDRSNCITWIFCKLRKYFAGIWNYTKERGFGGGWPVRSDWMSEITYGYNRRCDFYTEDQFKTDFGCTPQEAKQRGFVVQFDQIGSLLLWKPPREWRKV